MNKSLKKILKLGLTSVFLIFSLTSCTGYKDIATGQNNFYILINKMTNLMYPNLLRHVSQDEVMLVSDFVNLDKLKNRSKLGFLLSDSLKNSLATHGFIVRETELRKHFEFGKTGFNLLTRKQTELMNKNVEENYAMVGTYTITTESLILFIKLIDIRTGNILASMHGRTSIDEEILDLEKEHKQKRIFVTTPLVL